MEPEVDAQAAVLIRQGLRELAAAVRDLATLQVEIRACVPMGLGEELRSLAAGGLDKLSDLELTDLRIGIAEFADRLEDEVQRRRMAGHGIA